MCSVRKKTDWGVQLFWQGCREHVSVIADFIAGLGHEWLGIKSPTMNQNTQPTEPLDFTRMAWQFSRTRTQSKTCPSNFAVFPVTQRAKTAVVLPEPITGPHKPPDSEKWTVSPNLQKIPVNLKSFTFRLKSCDT
jgi:hypothetical protein